VALENQGIPTVTLISCSFCTLAQAVSRQLDYPGLAILLLPHPIAGPDAARVRGFGADAGPETARLLTTPEDQVAAEFRDKIFPLPEHAVARW